MIPQVNDTEMPELHDEVAACELAKKVNEFKEKSLVEKRRHIEYVNESRSLGMSVDDYYDLIVRKE